MLGRCVTIFSIIIFQLAQKANGLESCGSNSSDSRLLRITVNSKKDDTGKWTDAFYTKAEHSDTLSDVSIDVKHNISQCSGRRIIQIQGLIQKGKYDAAVDEVLNRKTSKVDAPAIYFHPKQGKNIVVSNNRRTMERKSREECELGLATTNRPIEDDELFEVRLDQKNGHTSLGIGILTKDPEEVEILPHMYKSEYAWMYVHNHIYTNLKIVKDSYGYDLKSLPVNSTVGIMKKPSGYIHFYVNQLDQGPAVSGISDPVYGIIVLGHNVNKATIVKP